MPSEKSSKRPELAKSEVIAELPMACADETAAVEFLERKRWGDSPCCPHCGSIAVYKMTARDGSRNKRFMWRCRDCGRQYTVRAGTVLSESLLPLRKWCYAMWMAATAKNGVSALELKRSLQINYRTALFLLHRLRHAMAEMDPNPPKLSGTVEVDETFCGGRPRHVIPYGGHAAKRNKRGRGTRKVPVIALVERGGAVRAEVVPSVTAATVKPLLEKHVERGSRIMTDELNLYRRVVREHGEHRAVMHCNREYVNKADPSIHTNTIEGFFSRVKRGLNGTYHAVSKKHLHRYIAQFQFLYNTREMTDGERVVYLFSLTDGKRLMYRDPVGKVA